MDPRGGGGFRCWRESYVVMSLSIARVGNRGTVLVNRRGRTGQYPGFGGRPGGLVASFLVCDFPYRSLVRKEQWSLYSIPSNAGQCDGERYDRIDRH